MVRKKQLRILHIAVINAGFPSDFCKMHNRCGDYTRLVTFYRNKMGFPEDICLDYKLPKGRLVHLWRQKKQDKLFQSKKNQVHYFKPHNFAESIYFNMTDISRKPLVNKVINNNHLDDFDVYHYDFGLDFYRNSFQAKKWKKMGKKLVCCYYGSDLRIRGIIETMEKISDLNITAEYDHLTLKPDLEFMFYPYDTSELPERCVNNSDRLKIVHSPTNRQFKGTETIINVIKRLKKERDFEFHLLENKPRSEVLDIKSKCDIGIECVGGSMGGYGYGKSGLEMLGLGLPVITSMSKEYSNWLPDNPFILANTSDELYEKILYLLDNRDEVLSHGRHSKHWVDKYHSLKAVNKRLYELYGKYNII